MKTEGRRQSENVEDRRGSRGFGGRIPLGRAGGGLGLVVIVILALLFGVDPRQFLGTMEEGAGPQETGQPYRESSGEAQRSAFVRVVLADTEDTWDQIFRENGRDYKMPTLVLFRDAVRSACGFAESASGPFYCPADQKVYLDLSFYDEMAAKLGARGDFAFAYVVAHEVGHHVQNLLGTASKVANARRTASEAEANEMSVRLELQADCLAGVWAARTERQKRVLEQGDIEEAMNAAAAVGDDRLQRRAQGYVVPESFTHGSSAQRAGWFKRGLQSADPAQCDTFRGAL